MRNASLHPAVWGSCHVRGRAKLCWPIPSHPVTQCRVLAPGRRNATCACRRAPRRGCGRRDERRCSAASFPPAEAIASLFLSKAVVSRALRRPVASSLPHTMAKIMGEGAYRGDTLFPRAFLISPGAPRIFRGTASAGFPGVRWPRVPSPLPTSQQQHAVPCMLCVFLFPFSHCFLARISPFLQHDGVIFKSDILAGMACCQD